MKRLPKTGQTFSNSGVGDSTLSVDASFLLRLSTNFRKGGKSCLGFEKSISIFFIGAFTLSPLTVMRRNVESFGLTTLARLT